MAYQKVCPRCGGYCHRTYGLAQGGSYGPFPSCLACGWEGPTQVGADMLPEGDPIQANAHPVRRSWSGKFVVAERGNYTRKERPVHHVTVSLEYIAERGDGKDYARILAVTGYPPQWSAGNRHRWPTIREAFERDTGMALLGLADALEVWDEERADKISVGMRQMHKARKAVQG